MLCYTGFVDNTGVYNASYGGFLRGERRTVAGRGSISSRNVDIKYPHLGIVGVESFERATRGHARVFRDVEVHRYRLRAVYRLAQILPSDIGSRQVERSPQRGGHKVDGPGYHEDTPQSANVALVSGAVAAG